MSAKLSLMVFLSTFQKANKIDAIKMKRRKLNDLEKEKEKLEDELHKKRAELKIIVINECLSKFKDKIVQDADVIFTTLNSAVCSVMEENLANPR